MPLPIGQWNAVIDGSELLLLIEAVDAAGEVRGSLAGLAFRGVWSEVARRIGFAVVDQFGVGAGAGPLGPVVTSKTRFFHGCLMQTPPNPQPGADLTLTLAGTYEAGPDVGGTGRRASFGWYATIKQVVE